MAVCEPFLPGAFEPETIAAMSEAFEAACKKLGDTGPRETLAIAPFVGVGFWGSGHFEMAHRRAPGEAAGCLAGVSFDA